MHVDWKFTGDGILAFLGGAFAIVAVLLSNRRSKRNLQAQLDAEKNARREEQDRRNNALATEILFEIDSLYRLHVREVHATLKNWDPASGKLFLAKSVTSHPFPVYEGTRGSLGSLDSDLVFSIVSFYSIAGIFFTTLRDYKIESERCHYGMDLPVSDPAAPLFEANARTLAEQLKNASPRLIKFAFLATKKLCEKTGVEFRAPTIAIAGANLSVEGIVAEQQAANA